MQLEIEKQMELGGEGLEESDKWMMEVNLDNLEQSTGEPNYYWLVAVQAARESYNLRHRRRQTNSSGTNSDHG